MDLCALIDRERLPHPVGLQPQTVFFRYRFWLPTAVWQSMTSSGAWLSLAIAAGTAGTVALPLRLDPRRLVAVLDSLERRGVDSVLYSSTWTCAAGPPVQDPALHVTTGRRLPVFHIPKCICAHPYRKIRPW
jgi:hypothetical protein